MRDADIRSVLERLLEGPSRLGAGQADLRAEFLARLATTRQELRAVLTRLRGDVMQRLDEHAAILTSRQGDIT
jgi:hypothetical protein